MILVKLLNNVVFKEEAFYIVLGSTKQGWYLQEVLRGYAKLLVKKYTGSNFKKYKRQGLRYLEDFRRTFLVNSLKEILSKRFERSTYPVWNSEKEVDSVEKLAQWLPLYP